MSKRFTKIICAILSAVVACGILLVAGCSTGHTDKALGGEGIFTEDKAISNGGFAVEKGNYIYYINGVASNSAKNDYGTPVRGAIARISKTDFAARNYSKTDIVVPQIAYSGNHNGGIFIYGDEVYYGTPSTAKNSEGAVQYSNLDMQSTKLDRSRTSAPYISFSDDSYEYRFVEVEGTVYLLYVATGETLYSESTGVTNIHSLNTKTGKNTLLAYNVASVMFDGTDKTNPRVYYTMNVKNYAEGQNYGYNQIYTVTADKTEANEYDTSSVIGWDKDNDRYINCGDLVFEGVGGKNVEKTPFNYLPDDETAINTKDSYTYTLSAYEHDTLFFTRNNTYNQVDYLYSYKDGAVSSSNPVKLNEDIEGKELLKSGANASSYKYVFEGEYLKAVIFAESSGGVSINYVNGGKLNEDISHAAESKYFNIVKDGTATLLFLDEGNKFLYYSVSGGSEDGTTTGTNGHSVWRVNYGSDNIADYEMWKPEADAYSPVQILNVDATSDWYLPEIVENQLLYPNAASDMSLYTYIMACDLRNSSGTPMTNAEIRTLNEKYKSIEKTIETYADTEKYPSEKYQNIQNVLHYGFYTAENEYIKEHQKNANGVLEEDATPVLSDETMAEYEAFLTPTADNKWADFTDKKTVNGNENVYANYRDYYYCLLGKMSSSDADGYRDSLVSTYLPQYEVETQTWWESIGTVGRVFFIIGMCAIGLIVIAGVTILIVVLVKRKKKGAAPKRRRIKVDTTDDKSIDVYNN